MEGQSTIDQNIRIHITGFGPFAGVSTNPSSILVSNLLSEKDSSIVSNYVVEVSTKAADEILNRICEDIDSTKTGVDVLLHFGVAAGLSHISIEECAYNDADFRVPDVLNYQPRDEAIIPSLGPRSLCLNTSLDCTELVNLLVIKGWNVSKSKNPGRFLCNYIYFKSLLAAKEINTKQNINRPCILSLFVHVPLHTVVDVSSQLRFGYDLITTIKDLIFRKCFIESSIGLNPLQTIDQTYDTIKSGDFSTSSTSSTSSSLTSGVDVSSSTRISPSTLPVPVVSSQPSNLPPLYQTLLDFGFKESDVKQAIYHLGTDINIETAIEYIAEVQQSAKERIKLVLVVRSDLEMTKGKIAAQCSHAALKALRLLTQDSMSSEKARRMREIKTLWEGSGEKIVVVKGDGGHEQLQGIYEQAKNKGILTGTIRDAGRTQVEAGSMTVLFVGPDREHDVDLLTGHLKLL